MSDDQWDMLVPPDFIRRRTDHTPTMREIINYHAYDDAWVPDMLAGRTMAEVGVDAFSGDLLGHMPRQRFAAIVDRACAAAGAVSDLDAVVHLSFGDFSVREYFWQINNFRALRSIELARIFGQAVDVEPELVQGVLDEISPHIEGWRKIGVFPEPIAVPHDAPLLDRLLGMTGRQPLPVAKQV